MFGRFFEPAQIKDCRFALAVFGERLRDEVAWEEIARKVEGSIVREKQQIRSRMVMSGDLAKHVVGDMIAITCLNDIELGCDHIYRGVLSMHGQSKRNIFAAVVTEQFSDGWISPQELGIANDNMKRAVAGAG